MSENQNKAKIAYASIQTIALRATGVLLLGGLLYLIFTTKQVAHYYPDENNLTIGYQSPVEFVNHARCREWARTYARENGFGTRGVYACGKQCNFLNEEGYWKCKDYTIRYKEPLYQTL